jgi:hypothetical protein
MITDELMKLQEEAKPHDGESDWLSVRQDTFEQCQPLRSDAFNRDHYSGNQLLKGAQENSFQ